MPSSNKNGIRTMLPLSRKGCEKYKLSFSYQQSILRYRIIRIYKQSHGLDLVTITNCAMGRWISFHSPASISRDKSLPLYTEHPPKLLFSLSIDLISLLLME